MRFPLPDGFTDRLQRILSPADFRKVIKTFVKRPPTFRVNTLKTTVKEVEWEMKQSGFKLRRIPWYGEGFILDRPGQRELEKHRLFKEGHIYLQSLASMVPPLILEPKPGERVLDLTAAPGSKTSQIASIMRAEGEFHANDNNQVRYQRLLHNLEILGCRPGEFVKVSCDDGADLCSRYPAYFDRILLDAPCSGESRFVEGDGTTYGYWSEKKIRQLAALQRHLLSAAWFALKPGGTLVYSTCTFAPEENEAQIDRLIRKQGSAAEVISPSISLLPLLQPLVAWGPREYAPPVAKSIRLLPDGFIESFFIAKVRKVSAD